MTGWGRVVVLAGPDADEVRRLEEGLPPGLSLVVAAAGVRVLGDGAVTALERAGGVVVLAGHLHGIDGLPWSDPAAAAARVADLVAAQGARALDRVLGDVAVVAVDAAGVVTAFREVTGARPMYTGRAGTVAVAGSDWFDLARATGRVRPSRHWVAHYVAGVVCPGRLCPDERFTQVLPGEVARHAPGDREWLFDTVSTLRPRRAPRGESATAAAARFREAVDAALLSRSRERQDVAVSLSGGLDSTSVLVSGAATNPDTRWHGFAIPFTSPEGDERARQQAVAEAAGAALRWVPLDGRGPFGGEAGYTADLRRHGAPSLVPNWFMLDAVAEAMVDDGIAVAMGGEDPDSLLGHFGYSYLSDLALRLRWASWYREASAARHHYRVSYRSLVRLSYELLRPPRPMPATVLSAPELAFPAAEACGERRPARRWRPGRMFDEVRRDALGSVHLSRVQDEAARPFRSRGLAVSQPLMDRRVMELAAGLPWRDVVQAPDAKQVLRTAMKGRLPDEVRTRRTKAVLSAPDVEAITGWQRGWIDEGLAAAAALPQWFDPSSPAAVTHATPEPPDPHRQARTARLALWLQWCAHEE